MALYDSDFDGIRFHVQLQKISEYCKEIVDTGSVRTVTEVLRNLKVRNHLYVVYKLVKLIMVMPATNFTSERTFSLLKLIKTYLRPTMTQGRLNHTMILSAYRNRLDEMDLRKTASIFVQKMTVADIPSINSNFVDVAYLKWSTLHSNIFVNSW